VAYADIEIPLGHERWMFAPKIVAKSLDALQIKDSDKVLEIGTGSGYLTVLLAKLARHVVSVDNIADFTESAAQKLSSLGINNVDLVSGDLIEGWIKNSPYDAIVVSGAIGNIPINLQKQLAIGGRLFVIVGEAPVMRAYRVTCTRLDQWQTEELFDICTATLPQTQVETIFKF